MNDRLIQFINKRRSELLPFILSFILSSAVFSVYSIPVISLWTVATLLITVVFYLFCGFVNKHHFIGGILYFISAIALMILFFILVFSYDFGAGFQQWFLTGAENADTQFDYLLALLISFAPFFASVVYYFGCVLYRMSFLTLISLIPCALYVKVLSDIDNVYIALIAILNVAILMANIRSSKDKGRIVIGKNAAVMAAGVFAFVLLTVSALIPKENDARYYDRFEQLFMDNSGIRPIGDYTHFSEFSGNADLYRNFTNRYLYLLYSNKIPYFKRQTFDYYDFENDWWYPEEYYSEPHFSREEWQSHYSRLNLGELQKAIRAAEKYSPGFAEKYGLKRLYDYEDLNDPLRTVTVEPQHFGAVYYLSPARIVNIITDGKSDQIYVTRSGVFRSLDKPHREDLGYNIWYYDETDARFFWFELGGADFSNEMCEKMLTDLTDILSENDDELSSVSQAYLDEHNDAMRYRTKEYITNTDRISENVHNLALQITAGTRYDWEKASLLQQYFINNGYIYDMEYNASDTSPEYFLFKSKKGSCSDYASAYVLMARSLGLTVRYAEGYAPDITSREGVFSIKDSSSHAYPEVYIQNMGWMVFEPTVPSDYSQLLEENGLTGQLEIDYNLVMVIIVIFALILLTALGAFLIIPVFSERSFMKKMASVSADECVIMVYKRISSKTAQKIIKNTEVLTPYELMDELEKMTGCDTGNFAYSAEKIVYGGIGADENDRIQAEKCYMTVKTAVSEYMRNEIKRKRQKNNR